MENRPNHCTNCGSTLNAGSSFCRNCGKHFEITPQTQNPQITTPTQPEPAYGQGYTQQAMPTQTEPAYGQGYTQQAVPTQPEPAYGQGYTQQAMPTQPEPAYGQGYTQQAMPTQPEPAYGQGYTQQAVPTQPESAYGQGYTQQAMPTQPESAYGQGYTQQAMPTQPEPTYGQGYTQQAMSTQPEPAYGQAGGDVVVPREKKSKAPLVIVLVLILLAALCVVGGIFLNMVVLVPNEYDNLRSNILASATPEEVLLQQEQWQEFWEKHPDIVQEDLQSLMQVCETYENAQDGEARYIEAIEALTAMQESGDEAVALAAETLLFAVTDEYVNYMESIGDTAEQSGDWDTWMDEVLNNLNGRTGSGAMVEGGETASGGATGETQPFDLTTIPLQTTGDGLAVWDEDAGERYISFDADNVSGKEIVYFEALCFFFDESGAPMAGENNDRTWEYYIDSSSVIAPGDGHWASENGYWACDDHTAATYAVLLVSYAEYADGSTWGEYFQEEPTQEFADELQVEANNIMAQAL